MATCGDSDANYLLPSTLYFLSTYSAVDLYANVLHNVSNEIGRRLMEGREQLRSEWQRTCFQMLDDVKCHYQCRQSVQDFLLNQGGDLRRPSAAVFNMNELFISSFSCCTTCQNALSSTLATTFRTTWDNLPKTFDLLPWEELKIASRLGSDDEHSSIKVSNIIVRACSNMTLFGIPF